MSAHDRRDARRGKEPAGKGSASWPVSRVL